MEKENNIYKVDAGNNQKVNTNAHFEEIKMIYQMALKADLVSVEHVAKREAQLQKIEAAVPKTVIANWQREMEEKESADVTGRIFRRQNLIEDAMANGGPALY